MSRTHPQQHEEAAGQRHREVASAVQPPRGVDREAEPGRGEDETEHPRDRRGVRLSEEESRRREQPLPERTGRRFRPLTDVVDRSVPREDLFHRARVDQRVVADPARRVPQHRDEQRRRRNDGHLPAGSRRLDIADDIDRGR
jgi:hypothetical protein